MTVNGLVVAGVIVAMGSIWHVEQIGVSASVTKGCCAPLYGTRSVTQLSPRGVTTESNQRQPEVSQCNLST